MRDGEESFDPARLVRPSAKISTVAKNLDCEKSLIRRLIQTGELQAHRIGKRAIRVYLDSVAAYQERMGVEAEAVIAVRRHEAQRRNAAANQEAMERLAATGVSLRTIRTRETRAVLKGLRARRVRD